MVRDAIIIGAGIVGATVSQALRNKGMDVLTLDDGRPMAGTTPSGGHLKPSWFGGMKKDQYEPAMEVLDQVWRLKEEQFAIRAPLVGKVASATIYRVDTDVVVKSPRTIAKVKELKDLDGFPLVLGEGLEERCKLLVIAAGAWCKELIPGLELVAKKGVSFRLKGRVQPFIKPWAPYKQIVAHQQEEDEVWVGDGSAILEKNWTIGKTQECKERCLLATGLTELVRSIHGLRPYCESGKDPCLLKKLGPRAWLATGAGKSGTISAGWASWRICNEL